MFTAARSSYLVPFDGSFRQQDIPTKPIESKADKKTLKKRLKDAIDDLDELQQVMYAHDRYSLLLVFQAMDAAGKDSTIRAVMTGINPAGCQVYAFKQPTAEELDHDFLWRTTRALPERGRIGIFNRSYYEEVLIVRVFPEFLKNQKLPYPIDSEKIWEERYESIRDQEKHLARNGTVILKFWLKVSREEQRARFLDRIEKPHKNYKFSAYDVEKRQYWDRYMEAYESALAATSKPWAPWYAIPADDKPYMRWCVASIINQNLKSLDMHYPEVDKKEKMRFEEMRSKLLSEP
jgi:PPK2 family polyphosphate:nucleotide phosphotransferase